MSHVALISHGKKIVLFYLVQETPLKHTNNIFKYYLLYNTWYIIIITTVNIIKYILIKYIKETSIDRDCDVHIRYYLVQGTPHKHTNNIFKYQYIS